MDTETDPVEALPSICGCTGKTSIEKIVTPARRRMVTRFSGSRVRLADASDAALLPLTENLERAVTRLPLEGDPRSPQRSLSDGWILGATFADAAMGTSVDRFATTVGDAYERLAERGRLIVGKAHSVQVPESSSGKLWVEQLRPIGHRHTGYWVANVDAVHAFPGLTPEQQAAIAVRHSLNDCYTTGGFEPRTVRPFVAVPDGSDVSPRQVRRWYLAGVPPKTSVLEGSIVRHDGEGWVFGATTTVRIDHRPPVRVSALEPGDAVLLHRPLGGLALYTGCIDSTSSSQDAVRERAESALSADHAVIARTIASFCPQVGEPFDPNRHIKLVTDITGDGISGLARLVGRGDTQLHVTAVPLLDSTAVDQVRDRWVVPDVTRETNGPLAMIGRPTVVRRIRKRLSSEEDAEPVRLGELHQNDQKTVSAANDLDLGRYIERFARVDPT